MPQPAYLRQNTRKAPGKICSFSNLLEFLHGHRCYIQKISRNLVQIQQDITLKKREDDYWKRHSHLLKYI